METNKDIVELKKRVNKTEQLIKLLDRIPQLQQDATASDIILTINKITASLKRSKWVSY